MMQVCCVMCIRPPTKHHCTPSFQNTATSTIKAQPDATPLHSMSAACTPHKKHHCAPFPLHTETTTIKARPGHSNVPPHQLNHLPHHPHHSRAMSGSIPNMGATPAKPVTASANTTPAKQGMNGGVAGGKGELPLPFFSLLFRHAPHCIPRAHALQADTCTSKA